MTTEFLGTGLPRQWAYGKEERLVWKILSEQIERKFPDQRNLLVSLTWLGPQFENDGWTHLSRLHQQHITFDNVFLCATVDPPYLNVVELQEVKNLVQALKIYYIGNFDSPHQFNFFAWVIGDKFKKYDTQEILLQDVNHIYLNYNRKPKPHRVNFVKALEAADLLRFGIVTLGIDESNDRLITIGEKNQDYLDFGNSENHWNQFGVPHDMWSLHRLDIWQKTFLNIVAATEFNPINDLFCQQDTFKPMIGLRPYVINGVQKTYRWLRCNGFRTFNHYWPHINIESGDVHDTLIDCIKYLLSLSADEIMVMYNDMLPDLMYNRDRFFEFSREQDKKLRNIFSE